MKIFSRPNCISYITPISISEILPVIDDPSLAEQTHWTVTKLCGWLREEKNLDFSYRTPRALSP
jgi:hypothetical protein